MVARPSSETLPSLQQIVDAADALFHVVPLHEPDGGIRDFRVDALNPEAEALLGSQSLDMGSVAFVRGFSASTEALMRSMVFEVLTTQLPIADERHFVDTNGDRWWEFRLRPMAPGVLVIAFDVTSRHAAETEAHDRYRLIAEHATDVILLMDNEGLYTWVSPSVSDLCGWEPGELVGRSFRDFVHPDDLLKVIHNRERKTADVTGLDALRFRCKADGYLWMSSKTRLFADSDGTPKGRVVALRDIHHQVEAQGDLSRSEARYRMLAENASDAVYQADMDGIVQWVSPSIEDLLGWRPEQFVGTSAIDLVHPDDLEEMGRRRATVRAGIPARSMEARVRTANGDLRWVSVQGRPVVDGAGAVVATVVGLRDCQAEVVARRARDTLSAATGILLHADSENALLERMCQAQVDTGGYLLAWYGRATHDALKTVEYVAASSEHAGYLHEVEISWDPHSPLGQGPGSIALREGRVVVVDDMQAEVAFEPWRQSAAAHGFRSAVSLPVFVDGVIDGAFMVNAAEPRAFDPAAVSLLTDLAGQLGYGLQRLRDQQRLRAAAKEQALLTAAIEQAAESVVITDMSASIVYANPAALRVSGYSLDELLGQNPRVFKSGLQDASFYDAMWANLSGGAPWRSLMVNRRKDGELYEEDVTITPIHDPNGELMAFVGTKRDLTEQRKMEADLLEHEDDRALMLRVMAHVRAEGSLAATAVALCEAIADIPSVDLAAVLIGGGEGFHVIGFAGDRLPQGMHAMSIRIADPADLLAKLDERARSLDLSEPAARALLGTAHHELLLTAGFTAMGLGAVRSNGEVIGVLATGTRAADGAAQMRSRRAVIEELGSFAGTLLAPQMDEDNRTESIRAELREILRGGHFHPVYQPIIDLATRQVCGYEALTRFADGTRPDVRFTMAHAVGLGSEMELACALAALEGARDLPPDVWLSINLSPESVVIGDGADLLAGHSSLRLVLEITEHAEIDDYGALRRALRSMAPVKVSVDDAGAGFASLRHILELKPDFVKLDLALVRGIDTDPARQALTVGLCHFAARTGAVLIAEGVESTAEADTLRGLGVPFGQGYLFGRPAPLN